MHIQLTPLELACDLTRRSIVRVRMAAVLYDRRGIFAWGWNYSNGRFGVHAEVAAMERSNPKRLKGANIAVAGFRKHGIEVTSRPCKDCWEGLYVAGVKQVTYYYKLPDRTVHEVTESLVQEVPQALGLLG